MIYREKYWWLLKQSFMIFDIMIIYGNNTQQEMKSAEKFF